MSEETKVTGYGLKNKDRQNLSQMLTYWPAVTLAVGGIVLTLGWSAGLVWLTLRFLRFV
jgi:hypothetical protein